MRACTWDVHNYAEMFKNLERVFAIRDEPWEIECRKKYDSMHA